MGVSRGRMVQPAIGLQAAPFHAAGLRKGGNWENRGCAGDDEALLEQLLRPHR